MAKLVLVGGVYKPPKLENVGQKFYHRGFEEGPRMVAGGTSNGSRKGPRMAAGKDVSCCPTLLQFEVPPQNPGDKIFDQNFQV